MANIVPFESALPAKGGRRFEVSDDLVSGGIGFPVISINGKVFHVKRGDESKMITKPDSPDEPASSIEVVMLGVYPPGNKFAKTYYKDEYSEGADVKPTCYSDDGEKPAADAEHRQAELCATCPKNAAGSKPSATNPKGRACSSSKRLAVATATALNDPMLLRIPGGSVTALSEFGKLIKSRGYPYQELVTKIGFDYTVAHPALTFKPVGVLDDATVAEVAEVVKSEVVGYILGSTVMPKLAAPQPETVKAEAPAEKKAEPAAEKPAAKPKAKPVVQETAEEGLTDVLDSLSFDD